jgi:hypothetical protein
MGMPEPIEPQADEVPAPKPSEDVADWLCGPEDGIDAEIQRRASETRAVAPKLFRPGADTPSEQPADPETPRREGPMTPPPRLTVPSAPDEPARAPVASTALPLPGVPLPMRAPGAVRAEEPDDGFTTGPTMLWQPGANSVPALPRASAPPPPAPPAPLPLPMPAMDFPMDDAEERRSAAAEAAATAAAAAERAAQPHTVVTPEAFDLTNAPAPWWMQLPQLLREDRRVQGLTAFVAVVLLAIVFWPKPEKSLSLGSIRHDPSRYDGQDVRVAGRVGEVFEVGGGYAYYLHQGRDTLVVFTRGQKPRRGQGVAVVGTISTGYLNGQAGSALFETVPR